MCSMHNPEQLRRIFNEMDADANGFVYFNEFADTLTQKLKLDLSEVEIERMWRQLFPSAAADEVALHLSFEDFQHGLRCALQTGTLGFWCSTGTCSYALPAMLPPIRCLRHSL